MRGFPVAFIADGFLLGHVQDSNSQALSYKPACLNHYTTAPLINTFNLERNPASKSQVLLQQCRGPENLNVQSKNY